jgi:hypothetical protein
MIFYFFNSSHNNKKWFLPYINLMYDWKFIVGLGPTLEPYIRILNLNNIYNLCVAPTNLTCHETFFSKYLWMDGYPSFFLFKKLLFKFYANGFPFFFLFKNSSFQILYKLVPMFSFLKISLKLQVDPIHEQIKFVQSLIKSTQVWISIKNSHIRTNPLRTNPIDPNQLSWNFGLKSIMPWKLHGNTWVIMCDGVVLNCIYVFCSFCLWWIACKV